MKNKFFKIKKNIPGFSLIEMLAVIFIVAIGLVGVSQLVVQSLKAQTINRRTIIAYQLAQEGIELVRSIRDTNWRTGVAWNTGLTPGAHCMGYNDTDLGPIVHDNCYLFLDRNGWYYHPAAVSIEDKQTEFKRLITIQDESFGFYSPYGNDAIRVNVVVEWYEGGTQLRYDASSELYNWY